MGAFKFIFAIIRWVISVIILLAIILFPIIIYNANPFTFYWDRIIILWDLLTSQGFFERVIGIFKSKGG